METKVCKKCQEEKNICEFGNSKLSKDGFQYYCKKCNNLRSKKYRQENYKKTLETHKNWRRKNPQWVYNRYKKWGKENSEKVNEIRKKWLNKNPEKRKEYRQNYNPRKKERRKERSENDTNFNLTNRMRSRLRKYLTIHNITKKNRSFEIVGCTPEYLKEHLEKQFKDGMSWENKDKWHIDHIIPLSSANTEIEIYKLCHYTNLQPLWAEENIKKSNKIVEPVKQQIND